MKSKPLILGLSLGILLLGMNFATAEYMIPEGETIIWRFFPAEESRFFVKVTVDSIAPINLTAYVYDPIQDTLTFSESFSDVALNWIYNETVFNSLLTTYTSEAVTRNFANRTVSCYKITIDSDNIMYVDEDTGVICEASFDLGDFVYEIELESWVDLDLSEIYSEKTENLLPGYPLVFILGGSGVIIAIIVKNKMHLTVRK